MSVASVDPRWNGEDHNDEQAKNHKPTPLHSTGMALEFHTLAALRAQVAATGPRRYLIRGLWPAGTYGVHAAEQKAQKSWNALDLAVSVASCTPWLDHFPIDDPGPVVVFAGEGGPGGLVRRLDAIARSRDLDDDNLQIAICTRAPHLSDGGHMYLFNQALERYKPRLVILDPLYLAARGAELTDLYKMGTLLERAQHICALHDAALFVVHHFNRSATARGASRLSGAGPAEWGRVLIGAAVMSRSTDPATRETRVVTELEVIGGDIADDKFRIVRTIRAHDPDDLDSPLDYTVAVRAADDLPVVTVADGVKPAAQRVLAVLLDHGTPMTVRKIGDDLAKLGRPLKARTIQDALKSLGQRVEGVEIDARGTTEWIAVKITE